MTEQSTNEGQPDPTLEPVLEREEGNKTPGNLEVGHWAIRDSAERFESIGIVAHRPTVAECTAPHEAGRIAR
jgi:hypothetical protein